MREAQFYQEVLAALEKNGSVENFRFEVMGIRCFVSRNIYPKSEFSAGITGQCTAIHHINTIRGCIGGFPSYTYEGDTPELKTVAYAIYNCARQAAVLHDFEK